MDVHRSRAECMIRLGDIASRRGDLLKAVELWESARPLFERSSRVKEVQYVDGRLSCVGSNILDHRRENMAHLVRIDVPSGNLSHIEDEWRVESISELNQLTILEAVQIGSEQAREVPARCGVDPKLARFQRSLAWACGCCEVGKCQVSHYVTLRLTQSTCPAFNHNIVLTYLKCKYGLLEVIATSRNIQTAAPWCPECSDFNPLSRWIRWLSSENTGLIQ
ncbi:hypothetical protein B0H14DRAFT_2597361 [Mycena olivaceomarginata]|nr:hypothetical protein B0H14DRAFT_2597361 [Mycena olivaceomarginata]